jgi:prephenate dehydrogenase
LPLANQQNLLESFDRFQTLLVAWRAALAAGDGAAIERLLSEAKQVRDAASG